MRRSSAPRRFVVAAAIILVLAWLGSFASVWRAARHDTAEPADAIVVMGAAHYNGRPSPVLKARLDHAADLFRRGLAPIVVVTGGQAPGDAMSEAEAGRRYLLEQNVADSVVVVEATGASTEPSLRAATVTIRQRGGTRVILVSDGFHLLRLTIVARRLGLVPFGSPAPDSPISGTTELGYILGESFKAPAAFVLTK